MSETSERKLRTYQTEALQRIRKAYKSGYKSPCLVAPCGAGKTVIMAEMARLATLRQNVVMFLVHRRELCDQTRKTFMDWGVDTHYLNVGMVQTITRRIGRIKPPSLIITDENHHCLANSYKKIYEAYPNAKRVGVTATPIRLNGGGLGDINDVLVESVSVRWLIDNGFLADFDYYAPSVMDLAGVKIGRGEYLTSDLEKKLDTSTIYGDVIEHYNKLAAGKQAICYCVSVKHSKRMAEDFKSAGIAASHIDGATPKAERDRVISGFRNGEIRVLCNVDLISEGFDVPDCEVCILVRPTKSLGLYIQQSMRCMRPKEGKKALIIDHAGNYARFGLPDMEREWTLDSKKRKSMDGEIVAVRQCPKCFYTMPSALKRCPKCELIFETKGREEKEVIPAEMVDVAGFRLMDWREMTSMKELNEYAKNLGYRQGWAYYKARELGIL